MPKAKRIEINPAVCNGKPVIRGIRIPVSVLLALLASKTSFNVMSMIGVILLMGLVTKNAILMVDFANQRRAKGEDRRDALINAGHNRLGVGVNKLAYGAQIFADYIACVKVIIAHRRYVLYYLQDQRAVFKIEDLLHGPALK